MVRFILFAAAACFLPIGQGPCAGELFDAARSYPIPYMGDARDVALADFNGDGLLDAAVANYLPGDPYGCGSPSVAVFLGQGNGVMSLDQFYDPPGVLALIPGDLDGDGNLDLVAAVTVTESTYGANWAEIWLLRGNGDGRFSSEPAFTPPVWTAPFLSPVLGDLDGDGDLDLAAATVAGVLILPGNGDGTFGDHTTYLIDGFAKSLAMDDLDGDGDLDLALASSEYQRNLSVLLNTGGGVFAEPVAYPVGAAPSAVTAVDMDDDGDLDLAVACRDEEVVSLYANSGNGTFSTAVDYPAGCAPTAAAGLDIDQDGTLDLVLAGSTGSSFCPGSVAVLSGNGDGTFDEPLSFPAGYDPSAIDTGDLDEDGVQDLVAVNRGFPFDYFSGPEHSCLTVLPGRGTDGFLEPSLVSAGGEPLFAVSEDMDLDGHTDLVTVDGENVAVILGRGDGSFEEAVLYPSAVHPRTLAIGDLDGDQAPDLVVAGDDSVEPFLGQGDGTITSAGQLALSDTVESIALGDFNADGHPDAAVPLRYDGVALLLGNGDGSFLYSGNHQLPVANFGVALAVSDLDDDGDEDLCLAVHDTSISHLCILIGNGDGTFIDGETHPVLTDVYMVFLSGEAVAVADANGDGFDDAAVSFCVAQDGTYGDYPHTVTIFFGTGDGSFTAGPELPTGIDPGLVAFQDLDNDADPDLLTADFISGTATVHLNDGSGGFAESRQYTCGPWPISGATCDVNGDGDPDLVTVHDGSSDLRVLYNLSSRLFLATGPGPGPGNPPLLRLFDTGANGARLEQWQAYGANGYGVNVALGDLDVDGGAAREFEIITGPGPGAVYGPHVRGFRPDGSPLPGVSFLAYGTNHYGVNVAAGDLDGDGFDEIVTGAGPGAVFGPHVRAWNWDGSGQSMPIPGISFFAYGTPKWGVNVACGDIDGDGFDEIVTGAGPGAVYGPHVRGWNWDGSGPLTAIGQVSFLAYGTNKWGVNVACGDIDGDGIDEIITGAGPGAVFGPHVRGWDWDGQGVAHSMESVNFFAFDTTQWGVYVSCGDLDGDEVDEILTGQGPGPDFQACVRGWNYDGADLALMESIDFTAYAPTTLTHGVKVAAGRAVERE